MSAFRDASDAVCDCVVTAKSLLKRGRWIPLEDSPSFFAEMVQRLNRQIRIAHPALEKVETVLVGLDRDPPEPIGMTYETSYARLGYAIAERLFVGICEAAGLATASGIPLDEDGGIDSQVISDNFRRVWKYLRDDTPDFDVRWLIANIRHEAGRAEKTDLGPVDGPWSRPESPSDWAKRFNCSSDTFKRMVEGGKIRSKKLSQKLYQVHVDDVPAD